MSVLDWPCLPERDGLYGLEVLIRQSFHENYIETLNRWPADDDPEDSDDD